MNRYPWLLIVVCLALVALFTITACAPPPPAKPPTLVAWYSAYDDTIHYDDAQLALVRWFYGPAGVAWITAHEEGHRTTVQRLRNGVDLAALMPGETMNIRLEQVAQCLAKAELGPEPWIRSADQIAMGYWDCPADYVAEVAS